MRLIHFSDLHVWRDSGWDGDVTLKRVLGRANLLLRRRRRFPVEWGSAVIEEIARRDADYVVFTGDISTAALRGEFQDARELVAPIREKWGERFIAIPGNHDRYTRRSAKGRLFENDFLCADQSYPMTRDLGDGVGVVGVDVSTPRAFASRGALSEGELQQIAEMVERQRADTPFVIVLCHYPCDVPSGVAWQWSHGLPLADRLTEALGAAGASLYLHGHKHERWSFRPDAASEMLCACAGSSGVRSTDPMKAAGFLEIDVGDGAVEAINAVIMKEGKVGLGVESFAL